MEIGAWRLDERLGGGAMGVVYGAHHAAVGTPVAVKVLTGPLADDPTAHAAFDREVRALAGVSHPHVVRVLDYGRLPDAVGDASAGSPFLVMERCSGGSALDAPPRSWPALHALIRAVLDGLAHVHAAGIVHRDLKPGNLLLAAGGDPSAGWRVADFGIAWQGRTAAEVAGTLRYMAPEQLRGDPRDLGPWTDLYALGRTVLELLTGDAHAPVDVLRGLGHGDLEAWVARLVEPDLRFRFRRAADAARALSTPTEVPIDVSAPTLVATAVLSGGTMPATEVGTATGPAGDEPPTAAGAVPLRRAGPPVPSTRPREAPPVVAGLRGVGLALFGLRPFPVLADVAADALWSALRDVEAGTPRAVVVGGPSGSGRRALVEAFARAAHATGAAHVLRGPLSEAIARHLRVDGLDGRALVHRLTRSVPGEHVAPLAEVLSPGASAHASHRVRLSGAAEATAVVRAWLAGLGRLVVWLTPTAEVLPRTLTVVVDEAGDPELGPRDRGALTRALVDHAGLARPLAHEVARTAGGLPGVARAIVADLVAGDGLRSTPAGYVLVDGATASLPADHRARWAERLRRVTTDADAPALALVAGLGRVDAAVWSRVAARAGVSVPADLAERLHRAGLARADGDGWALADPALVDLLTDDDPRWAAAILPEVTDPERRARLLLTVGDDRAIDALEAVARAHAVAGARGAAEALLHLRADALPPDDPRQVAGWVVLAGIRRYEGQYDDAIALATRALAGSAGEQVDALRVIARAAWARQDLQGAAVHLQDALSRGPAPEERALILADLADVHRERGDLEAALATDRAALAAFDAFPDHPGAPEAWLGHAFTLEARGDLDGAEAQLARVTAAYRRLGARAGLASAANARGDLARRRGDLDAAAAHYREALDAFRAVGSSMAAYPQVNLGLVHLERGDPAAARPVLEDVHRHFAHEGRRGMAGAAQVLLLGCAAADADWAEWDRRAADGLALLAETGFRDPDITRAGELAAATAEAAGEGERGRALRAALAG